MPDEHKPEGSEGPPPAQGEAAKPPAPAAKPAAKPAAPAPKPPAVMMATPWESDLARDLKERFGARVAATSTYLGQNFIVTTPDGAIPVLEYLKLEADFDYLVDITAVDWPKRAERFDLVYVVYSFPRNERARIKTAIPEGFQPQTAVGVHLTANWLEREVFDMFGIEFSGHPDMRRILMPDEWEGHPLRKDYSILQQDQRWVRENLNIESGQ
jgi:NADH-quinone oxidoreductase subunit C